MGNSDVVKKMKEGYGVNSDSALALAMGVTRGLVCGWKRADRGVPAARIEQAMKDTGNTYDFFIEGGDEKVADDVMKSMLDIYNGLRSELRTLNENCSDIKKRLEILNCLRVLL